LCDFSSSTVALKFWNIFSTITLKKLFIWFMTIDCLSSDGVWHHRNWLFLFSSASKCMDNNINQNVQSWRFEAKRQFASERHWMMDWSDGILWNLWNWRIGNCESCGWMKSNNQQFCLRFCWHLWGFLLCFICRWTRQLKVWIMDNCRILSNESLDLINRHLTRLNPIWTWIWIWIWIWIQTELAPQIISDFQDFRFVSQKHARLKEMRWIGSFEEIGW
jgi:hypothetical protein